MRSRVQSYLKTQKLGGLFESTQHHSFQSQLNALKANVTTEAVVTYTPTANHLSTAVSELPEYNNAHRKVAGVTAGIGNDAENEGFIILTVQLLQIDTIQTGEISQKEDKIKVINARKQLGIKLSKGGKGSAKFTLYKYHHLSNHLDLNKC